MVLVGEMLEQAWQRLAGLTELGSVSDPRMFSVIVLVVLGFVGGRIVGEVLRTLLKMTALDDIAVRSGTQILLRKFGYRGTLSDFLADMVRWTIYLLTLMSVFYLFGFRFLTRYSELLVQWLSRFVAALFILIIGTLVAKHIERITIGVFRAGRISSRADDTEAEIPVYLIAGRIMRYTGYLITILFAIGVLGVDVMVLNLLTGLFGLGIVLLLVLSFRDLGRNLAISIYLQLSRVFVGGEHIRIGDHEGEIVGIRPLYTKIRSDGTIYYIPNTKMVSDVIEDRGA